MFGRRACIFCAFLLPVATPTLAQTAVAGPDYWAVTGVASYDTLNLRMAPNADSRRIGQIPFNARGIKNYGCPNLVTFEEWKRMTEAQKDLSARSRWCQVEYRGMKGWVASRFLKEDGPN